jgi:hypothetical protein
VWRNSRRPPRFRFETIAEAEAEAERQARAHPGAAILILEERSRYICQIPKRVSPDRAEGRAGRSITPQTARLDSEDDDPC